MTSNSEWAFVAHGGANVIFTLYPMNSISSDPASSSKSGTILRVKILKQQPYLGKRLEEVLWSDVLKTPTIIGSLECDRQFRDQFITPVLGARFVDNGMIIDVPENLSCDLELDYRGLQLHDKTLFIPNDFQGCHAIGACLCLEIKPKCGFLPQSDTIHPRNEIKKQLSRYHLHQHLKLKQGTVAACSHYNPLDLFSDDVNLIKQSLGHLLETPQNNLHLFLNGKKLNHTNEGFMSDNIKCHMELVFTHHTPQISASVYRLLIETVAEILRKEEILGRILELQKLDKYDIEGVFPVYRLLLQEYEEELVSVDSTEDSCSTSTYSQLPNHCDGDEEHEKYVNAHMKLKCLPIQEKLQLLRDFLIALTAKDCSIYITFQLVFSTSKAPGFESDSFPKLTTWNKNKNISLLYKVQVGDLDLKPMFKIPYQYTLDQNVLESIRTSNP